MQQRYKDMLDQQLEVKQNFKMYGNMSSIEKALNKNDLIAFKNFDQRQFSLVPGIQHSKHIGSVGQSTERMAKQDSPQSQSYNGPLSTHKLKKDPHEKFLEKQN